MMIAMNNVVKPALGLLLVAISIGQNTHSVYGSIQAGMATIDGDISEWDTSTSGPDFYAPMHEAGNVPGVPSGNVGKDLLSNLFLRYDTSSEILYGLVYRPEGGVEESPTDAWFKEYSIGNSTLVNGNSGTDGTPPDFAWVYDANDNTNVLGYEASIELAAREIPYCDFEAHVNVLLDGVSRTSSTGRNDSGSICLELPPDEPMVPEPMSLFIWSLVASGAVGLTRNRHVS